MGTHYTGVDRRKFKRVPVSFLVFYKVNYPLEIRIRLGDKEINALAADICEDGMAAITNYEISFLANVTVRFIMSNDKSYISQDQYKSITARGELRYNVEGKRGYRMGIKFIELDADDRRFISNFVLVNGALSP
jgi:c-di-GMP-binding flagellar brake protein YcgR